MYGSMVRCSATLLLQKGGKGGELTFEELPHRTGWSAAIAPRAVNSSLNADVGGGGETVVPQVRLQL